MTALIEAIEQLYLRLILPRVGQRRDRENSKALLHIDILGTASAATAGAQIVPSGDGRVQARAVGRKLLPEAQVQR